MLAAVALFALFADPTGAGDVPAPGSPPPGEYRALGPGDAPYSLGGLERSLAPTGPVRCPTVPLVVYRGTTLAYQKPMRVYRDLVPRLALFEGVVRDGAREGYGRAPVRIRHDGTYNCRRIARFPDVLSEHGLGNAIDVEGFDFAAARGSELGAAPRGLAGRFEVRLGPHWKATRGTGAIHARFLATLAERLVKRPEIFRVLLGPAFPAHQRHFHFDMAPYRLVAIWDDPLAASISSQ